MADDDVDIRIRVLYEGRGTGEARAAIAQLNRDVERMGTSSQAAVRKVGQAAKETGAAGAKAGQDLAKGTESALVKVNALQQAYRAAATAIVGKFFFEAVKGAANLAAETERGARLFGASFGAVKAQADDASESLLVSSGKALELSNSFGVLFRQVGFGTRSAAEMSTALNQVAADLGAFAGVDTARAAADLRQGLEGSNETLERYGIFIDEAKVKTAAYAAGIAAQGAELTEGQKVLARHNLILEQATKAQGAAAASLSGTAGQAQRFQAKMRDLADNIGAALLPAADGVVRAGNSILGVFNDLPRPIQSASVQIGLIGAAGLIAAPRIMATRTALLEAAASAGAAGPALTRVGNALPKVAAGFAIAGVVLAAVDALNQMGPSMDKAVDAIAGGSRTMAEFNAEVDKIANPSGGDRVTAVAKDLASAFNPFDGLGVEDNRDNFGDARAKVALETFQELAEKSPVLAQQVILDFQKQGVAADEFQAILDKVKTAKAGELNASRVLSAAIAEEADALDNLGSKTKDTTKEDEARGKAILGVAAAARASKDAQQGLADAEDNVTSAQDRAATARDKLNDLLAESATRTRELEDANDAVADAGRRVEDAHEGVEDAQAKINQIRGRAVERAKDVERAERSLADAQESTATAQERLGDAQERLNKLREGATADEMARADLSAREAALGLLQSRQAVIDAEQRLDAIRREGDPDATARAEQSVASAQLGVEAAEFRLIDTERELAELREKGRDGTEEVVDAERDVADAAKTVDRAIRDEAQAQQELNEKRAADPTLTEDLEDATRELARAHVEVDRAIRDQTRAREDLAKLEGPDLDRAKEIAAARRDVAAAEREIEAAHRGVEAATYKVIEAEVAQYEQSRLLSGQLVTTRDSTRQMIQALDDQADRLAPGSALRKNLEAAVAQLRTDWERTYKATIDLDTDPATKKLQLLFSGEGWKTEAFFDKMLPFREHGGPVAANRPYIVGERRAELFVPDTAGFILPKVPDGFGSDGAAAPYAPTFIVYPAPGMDEVELARATSREAGWRQIYG